MARLLPWLVKGLKAFVPCSKRGPLFPGLQPPWSQGASLQDSAASVYYCLLES
jgi:hypothetical protein